MGILFLIDFVFSEGQDFQFDSENIYTEMQNEDYTLANVSGYKNAYKINENIPAQ